MPRVSMIVSMVFVVGIIVILVFFPGEGFSFSSNTQTKTWFESDRVQTGNPLSFLDDLFQPGYSDGPAENCPKWAADLWVWTQSPGVRENQSGLDIRIADPEMKGIETSELQRCSQCPYDLYKYGGGDLDDYLPYDMWVTCPFSRGGG